MKNNPRPSIFNTLIALVALLIAVIALVTAKGAKEAALSEVSVEEGETLTLPVFDEEQNLFSYVVFAEIHVTNLGGPTVTLNEFGQSDEGGGFLIALKNQQVWGVDLKPRLFLIDPTFAEIQAQPRLLKEMLKKETLTQVRLDHILKSGENKTIRYGVHFYPYNAEKQSLAEMVLISTRLMFDTGKVHLFRRGYPVVPLLP